MKDIKRENITINGVRIFYLHASDAENNKGDRAAVILIHGFLVSSLTWEDIIAELDGRFDLYAPDLPGCGESDNWINPDVNFTKYASFIREFCDELELKNVVLIAHSMGGGIAIVTGAMYGEYFTRLILIDSVSYPFPTPLKGRIIKLPGVGSFIFSRIYGWGMFRSYFRNDVYYDKGRINEDRLKKYYEYFDTRERRDFSYRLFLMTLQTSEVESAIPKVNIPSLIIWGDKDNLIPISCGYNLAGQLRSSKLEVVTDCGHAPQEEKPLETSNLIKKFIEEGFTGGQEK